MSSILVWYVNNKSYKKKFGLKLLQINLFSFTYWYPVKYWSTSHNSFNHMFKYFCFYIVRKQLQTALVYNVYII